MRDESGLVASGLLKAVLALAVLAVAMHDLVSIGVNYFTLDATATEIALQAGGGDSASPTGRRQIELEAQAAARAEGARLIRVVFDPQARRVRVVLARRAPTLALRRIPQLRHLASARVSGRAALP